ncbi:MAG: hypothetical protein V3V96_15530 [Acidiferrobacterales bacterium]
MKITFEGSSHVVIGEMRELLKASASLTVRGFNDPDSDPNWEAKSEHRNELGPPSSDPDWEAKQRKGRPGCGTEDTPTAGLEPEPTKRRRTRGAAKKPAGQTASSETDGQNGSASTEDTSEPEPTKRRRGRKTTSTKTEPATSPEDDAPARRRRKRGAAEDEKPKRRGRKKKDELAKISDSDLVKAASSLAEATNPQVVMDLLEEFGVAQVQQLEGDQRQEFLFSAEEMEG